MMLRFYTLGLTLALVVSLERSAHAYLDPGTGSQALQMGLAGFFGALFTLKMFWQRVLQLINTKQNLNKQAKAE